jgi:hypothetical protein
MVVEQVPEPSEAHVEPVPDAPMEMMIPSSTGELAAAAYRRMSGPLLWQIADLESRGEPVPSELRARYKNLVEMSETVRRVESTPGPSIVGTLAALIRSRRKRTP